MIINKDNVIDSRDIIERIEELEELIAGESTGDEFLEYTTEYDLLSSLAEECSDYASDWEYGETLIHEDYFEQYMDEMVRDCGYLPKDIPDWISISVDYDALKQDYTEVDFDGETYYIRCV